VKHAETQAKELNKKHFKYFQTSDNTFYQLHVPEN